MGYRKPILVFLVVLLLGHFTIQCFYNNYQFWTHIETNNLKTLSVYDGSNIKGLLGRQVLVHKEFIVYLKRINTYAAYNEVNIIVNQGYRSSGASINRPIVRPASISNHFAGFAIDFNIVHNKTKYFAVDLRRGNLNRLPKEVRCFIEDIRQDPDLRWGGDFMANQDPVHIDVPINVQQKEKWLEYKLNCDIDNLNKVYKWDLIRKLI